MSGSKNMSYDSASLTVSNIHWLGVLPSDLDKYNIPEVRTSPGRLTAPSLSAYSVHARSGMPPANDRR